MKFNSIIKATLISNNIYLRQIIALIINYY